MISVPMQKILVTLKHSSRATNTIHRYIDIETFVYKRKPFFFLSPRDFLLFRHNLAPHLFDKLTHVSIDFRHDQSERYSLDLKPGNQDTIDEDVKELLGEHFTEYENVSVWAATCIAISRMPSLKNVNIRLRAAVFCRVLQASADFRENEYSENDDPVWQVKASEKPIMEPLQVAGRALKDANISVEVDWPIPPGDQDWSGGNLALKRWHRCSTCGLICDLSANRHDTGHCAAHFVVGPRSVWAANYLHTPAARFSND